MTGQRDKVYEAVLYSIFLHGKTNELLRQNHGKTCANPQEAKVSKRFIGKDMLIEAGKSVLRVLVPYLTPYILAALTGFGAMIVALWKAMTRGWLGFLGF